MDKKTTKYKIIITIILRNIIYLCWYTYAFIILYFIQDKLTDKHLFSLFIGFIIVYFIRALAKHFYKNIAHDAYHQVKHSIEMEYYQKLNEISMDKLDKIDKEYLANKILEVSYNSTKIICDIGEYLIPGLIGLIIIMIELMKLNYLVGIVVIILLTLILGLRYRALKNGEPASFNNYNDLLKDFVMKILTIRKINVFDYSYELLDKYNENDIIILKHNDEVNDIKFNNGILLILAITLLSTFFIIKNTTTRLGIMAFFIICLIKLQDLLYQVAPMIINIRDNKKNKSILDSNFTEIDKTDYETNWKKIVIENGIIKYGTGVSISIPSFELTKGDQISILGKSGQGKSTILNVLSGVSTLSEGEISFDNKKVNKVVDACHITKDAHIFKISLRDNICLGENVSDNELLHKIEEIGLMNWYNSLSHGLDTLLDEKEIKMTTSEKQRINILRAMNTSKEVIFIDEPSSDLDVDTETKVAEMIKKYLKKKTLIIVTHKAQLTTICKKHFFVQDYTLLETEPLL